MRSFHKLLVIAALLARELSAASAAESSANQPSPNQSANPSPNPQTGNQPQQPGYTIVIPEKFPGTEKPLFKAYEMYAQVDLLLSRKPEKVLAAEKWFEREHEALIAQFKLVDPSFQQQILHALNYWISPWQRSLAQRGFHHIHLGIPVRPVTRPVDDPRAAKFRTFLLTIVANADKLPVETAAKELTWEESQQWSVLETAYACLGEVADAATAQQVRIVLEKIRAPEHGRWCMNCLEQIYGLPEFYRPIGICGMGMEKFEARERWRETLRVQHYEPGRTKLLAWLDQHAKLDETARCRAVLKAWDQFFQSSDSSIRLRDFTYYPIHRLARLGEPLVPLLREQQQLFTSLLEQQVFPEYIAAAITGKVDDRLVRDLLREVHVEKKVDAAGNEVSHEEKVRDRQFHLFALRIIQAGNAKGYLPELTAMLKDERYSTSDVARTLALVHGREALPILRSAPKENYTATAAVAELEKREE